MSHTLRVTVLIEDTANARRLLGEHGLAFWVQAGPKRVLFDTGQGMALEHNAQHLEIALESADAVVLSHGHYDHTGGLSDVLRSARRSKVFAHPAAFAPKYACNRDGSAGEIGMPFLDERKVRQKAELVWTKGPTEICPGLFVTGEIPRVTDFEDTGGPFFLDEKCRDHDPLLDDQAMFFQAAAGTIVLLGCAHAGVINTLRYIRQLTNNRSIHAVIGGMHLVNASPERIARTVEALRQFNVALLAPAHCTGMGAMVKLWAAAPGRCFSCVVGTATEFEGP